MVFGLTDSYKIDIHKIEYIIYRYHQLINPIGINIFPIPYSLFPIPYWLFPIGYSLLYSLWAGVARWQNGLGGLQRILVKWICCIG